MDSNTGDNENVNDVTSGEDRNGGAIIWARIWKTVRRMWKTV